MRCETCCVALHCRGVVEMWQSKMAERHADAPDCSVRGATEEELWSCTQTLLLHFTFQKEGRSVRTGKDDNKGGVKCLFFAK